MDGPPDVRKLESARRRSRLHTTRPPRLERARRDRRHQNLGRRAPPAAAEPRRLEARPRHPPQLHHGSPAIRDLDQRHTRRRPIAPESETRALDRRSDPRRALAMGASARAAPRPRLELSCTGPPNPSLGHQALWLLGRCAAQSRPAPTTPGAPMVPRPNHPRLSRLGDRAPAAAAGIRLETRWSGPSRPLPCLEAVRLMAGRPRSRRAQSPGHTTSS